MDHQIKKNLVSVIIPCRNEERYILHCLEAIHKNDYPQDLIEIIVVDGMSDDHTIEMIRSYKERPVKIIENLKRTTPFALNIGIENASGEYILICSSRVILSDNYISHCVKILCGSDSIACVGNGNCENLFENNEAKTIAKATSSRLALGFGNPRIINESQYSDNADTPMYKRSVFESIGGFDESFIRNQDDELNFRLVKAGHKIFVAQEISIKYYVRSSYRKLFRQYFQYGYWKILVNKKHKTLTTSRQLIPTLFILFIPLGMLFFYMIGLPSIYWAVIILYYCITLLQAIILADSFKNVFLIQYAFFNFHFGYGFGYLAGIIDFLFLNKQPSEKQKQLTR